MTAHKHMVCMCTQVYFLYAGAAACERCFQLLAFPILQQFPSWLCVSSTVVFSLLSKLAACVP